MKVTIKHIDSDVPKENYEFYNDCIKYLQQVKNELEARHRWNYQPAHQQLREEHKNKRKRHFDS